MIRASLIKHTSNYYKTILGRSKTIFLSIKVNIIDQPTSFEAPSSMSGKIDVRTLPTGRDLERRAGRSDIRILSATDGQTRHQTLQHFDLWCPPLFQILLDANLAWLIKNAVDYNSKNLRLLISAKIFTPDDKSSLQTIPLRKLLSRK